MPEKQTIENIKTVTIAVLITAIVSFIAGGMYGSKQQATVEAARSQAQVQPVKK